MRDPDEATDGPTDPRVHPEESPGFGEEPDGLEDIEVSRDVTIGDASPRELQATDTAPLRGTDAAAKIEDLVDGDPVERRRAALALGEGRPSEAAVDALIDHGLADDDADVRQFAVEALGELGGGRAGEAAVAACDDPDPWVRAEAVVALDRIDRGEALLPVLLELSHAESERLREWAIHLLAGVDDERALDRLEAVAGDETEPKVVRSTAARAIDADPGKFRRQFSGGTENDSADLPGESTLNRRPDL